jgi:uncharacterized membrane protein YjgN (DUF898 family)
MTKAITQINKEKAIFWMLISILILSVGFYMYCIKATVKNVVLREELENQSIKIALNISNKEFQYISMRNSITLDFAHNLGFKNVANKTFITRNTNNVVSYAPKGL